MLRANPRTSALVALALVVAGGLAASTARFLLRAEKKQYLDDHLKYLETVTDIRAESIRDFHHERLHDLRFYADSADMTRAYRRLLKGDTTARGRVASEFARLIDSGRYESVSLTNRQGTELLRVPADAAPHQPTPGPTMSPRLTGMHRSASDTTLLDYEATTVDDAQLLFRIRAEKWIFPLVERWPGLEKSAETIIFQREDAALVSVSRHRGGPGPLRLGIAGDTLAARAARGETGPLLARDYAGTNCYGVVRAIPDIGWLLVAKVDEDEIMAPLRDKIVFLTLAVSGILALAGAGILVFIRAQADRRQAETDAERRLLSAAIEQAGESIVITDKNGVILYTNPAFTRATGYSREESYGKTPAVLKSGRQDAAFYKNLWETLDRGETWEGRFVNRSKDGRLFEEDATIAPVRDQEGAVTHYIAVKRDVSAVKSLEDQLFHSQKMEAIGRLAGGIAHDFNNILTTINGYAEMLADASPPDSQASGDLAEILGAGRRAALLTRQLLTFSRRAPADPVVLDLRASIRGTEKILRRTLGEDVRLSLDLPGKPLWVKSDPGQLDQVLMNLAVNARDAMPRGGTLAVRAHAALLESDEVHSLEVIPAGRYAVLVVADGGEGMDAAILSRIFEPFFTTKEKGKGTGLGLATVFGIVKQNKGHISVESVPGGGATFTIHLPLVPAPADLPSAGPPSPASTPRGDETVLVVEDQAEVLRLVSRALTPQGYRVLSCGSANEALEMAHAFEGPIHLLLTDVVMPGMGGAELAVKLRRARPETRVLYMSGYTDGRLDGLGEAGQKADLLLKPFTAEQVCRRVRGAIDGAPPRMA
jgi:PAS domain S-box-containing protein